MSSREDENEFPPVLGEATAAPRLRIRFSEGFLSAADFEPPALETPISHLNFRGQTGDLLMGDTIVGRARLNADGTDLEVLEPGIRPPPRAVDFGLVVEAEVGRAILTTDFVAHIGPGSIIELDRSERDPLLLFVEGRLVAYGEPCVIESSAGLRITKLAGPSENEKRETKDKDPAGFDLPRRTGSRDLPEILCRVLWGKARFYASDLLAFKEGTVLEFERTPDRPCAIEFASGPTLHGEIVVFDDSLGVRVVESPYFTEKEKADLAAREKGSDEKEQAKEENKARSGEDPPVADQSAGATPPVEENAFTPSDRKSFDALKRRVADLERWRRGKNTPVELRYPHPVNPLTSSEVFESFATAARENPGYMGEVLCGMADADEERYRGPALLMVALDNDVAAMILKTLPDSRVEEMSFAIGRLESTDAASLERALESYQKVELEYRKVPGVALARRIMERALGTKQATDLMNRLTERLKRGKYDLDWIGHRELDILMPHLRRMLVRTCALVIGALRPEIAARILSEMEPERRERIIPLIVRQERLRNFVFDETAILLRRLIQEHNARKSGDTVLAEILEGGNREHYPDFAEKIIEAVHERNPDLARRLREEGAPES